MTEIIRKPTRLYPLPTNVRELDNPYPEIIRARHTRIPVFKDGYDRESGDNPTIVKPPSSPSTILSDL
ncbi:MAG: hypothetical protein KAS32_26160 [Candidatus Peribacteraceae bacterium]|nr:hypothetical protein [Candidatus Peribacteraceae bacterium]